MKTLTAVLVAAALCGISAAQAATPAGDDERVARGFTKLGQYKPDEAIAAFTGPYIEALAKNDHSRAARYLLLMSSAFRFDENMPSSLACCRQALLLDPASVRARTMTADTLARMGRLPEAEEMLRPLQPVAEKQWLVARSLGNLYAIDGDIEKALHYLNIANKLDPADARTHFSLARINFNGDAAAHYKQAAATATNPYLAEMYLWQAEQREHADKPDRAHLTKASKLLPDEPSWRTSLAWSMAEHGQFPQAYNLMCQAVQCRRVYWRSLTQLALFGLFHNHAQATDGAIAHLEQLQPESPEVYFVKAQVALNRNRQLEAERNYRRALELNPRLTPAFQGIAGILLAEKEQSKQDALGALWQRNCPYLPDPWLYQAKLQRNRGQWQPALDNYEKAQHILAYSQNNKSFRNSQWYSLSSGAGTAAYKLADSDKALRYALIFNSVKPQDDGLIRVRPGRIAYDQLQGRAKSSAEHGLLADMLYETGQLDDCVGEYEKALALQDNIEWHRGLLKAYIDKRDFAAATKEDFIVANHAVTHEVPAAMDRAKKAVMH